MARLEGLPHIRREDGCLVGTDYARKRWGHGRIRQFLTRLRCTIFGHDYRPWLCDDYEGPGEQLEGGGWMPFCSREAGPQEWGSRGCFRGCGLAEHRWPEEEAPILWFAKLAHQERKDNFPSTVPHHTIPHYKTGKRS